MPIQMDSALLRMALIGFEAERQKITDKIADIQRQLSGKERARGAGTPADRNTPMKRGRRTMSASARKRLAAAQKKRWAEYRKTRTSAARLLSQ